MEKINELCPTASYTQLPCLGVAYLGSIGYQLGNPICKHYETATANTGEH
jgi:hypothetical protein